MSPFCLQPSDFTDTLMTVVEGFPLIYLCNLQDLPPSQQHSINLKMAYFEVPALVAIFAFHVIYSIEVLDYLLFLFNDFCLSFIKFPFTG